MKPRMRSVKSCVVILGLVVALLPGSPRLALSVDTTGEMLRFDWYFRESLKAIDDWESLLEGLEKDGPQAPEIAAFPVPIDGRAVSWPYPVPLELMPPMDRSTAVRLRLAGEKVEIERNRRDGRPERESVAVGATVRGYFHPGGGGKDQWYHSYQRRFDRLLTFRPVPAPFAVEIDGPLDLRKGRNQIDLILRSAVDKPVVVTWHWEYYRPGRSSPGADQTITLAPGAIESVRVSVDLPGPGGGLLRLKLEAEGQHYELAMLAHVENVASVLQSIEQILADTPDPQAAGTLVELKARADAPAEGNTWRSLFEKASLLRDELLLRRISFDTLLFVKRKPFFSEQPFMDAHHLFNRPGGAIFHLSPVRPGGQVTALFDSLGEGVYRDAGLH